MLIQASFSSYLCDVMTRLGALSLTRRLLPVRFAGAQDAVQRIHGGGGVYGHARGRGDGGARGVSDGAHLKTSKYTHFNKM